MHETSIGNPDFSAVVLDPHGLRQALDAEPGTAASRQLRAWLEDLDEAKWRLLLPELTAIAESLARRYPDVVEREDALGELSSLAYQRWIPSYLRQLRDGSAKTNLRSYLGWRLGARLYEQRRLHCRRRQLLEAGHGPSASSLESSALLAGAPVDPYDALVADEVVRDVASDPRTRAILTLRYAGFTQNEIAAALGVSRTTVKRGVASIAALIAACVAAALLVWWLDEEPETVVEQPRPTDVVPDPADRTALASTRTDEELALMGLGELSQQHVDAIDACWDAASPGDTIEDVQLRVRVDANGSVAGDLSDGSDSAVGRCFVSMISSWQLGERRPARTVRVMYRFSQDHRTNGAFEAPATAELTTIAELIDAGNYSEGCASFHAAQPKLPPSLELSRLDAQCTSRARMMLREARLMRHRDPAAARARYDEVLRLVRWDHPLYYSALQGRESLPDPPSDVVDPWIR